MATKRKTDQHEGGSSNEIYTYLGREKFESKDATFIPGLGTIVRTRLLIVDTGPLAPPLLLW